MHRLTPAFGGFTRTPVEAKENNTNLALLLSHTSAKRLLRRTLGNSLDIGKDNSYHVDSLQGLPRDSGSPMATSIPLHSSTSRAPRD